MEELSPYELLRLKRVEENRKVLRELGLLESYKPPVIRKPVSHRPAKPKNRQIIVASADSNEPGKSRRSIRTRNSTRLSLLTGDDTEFESDSTKSNLDLSEDESSSSVPKPGKVFRPNIFGHIAGIPVGTTWRTRMECSSDGVHRPTVAGIHGSSTEGAYSIALSGGYEDDVDFGEGFTYTGSGGRDLKGTAAKPKNLRTAPQSKDQTLEGVNGSLAASAATKHPIRVIRGYKLPSVYAPEEGYRYDGLYTVEKFWFATGLSGYQVVKFALKRIKDQSPAPWDEEQLSVTETQADRLSRSPSTENIIQDDHTVNDLAEPTKLAISSFTEEQPLEISKSPNLNSRSHSPKKVINSPKDNLLEKSTSLISPKTVDSKEKHSPKISSAKKVHSFVQDNGTKLEDDKAVFQDPKTSTTLTKTSQLQRIVMTRNASTKKVVNSYDNETMPQGKEAVLQDQETSSSPAKTPKLEQNGLSRKTSGKKVVNTPCENGTSPKVNEAVLQDQKTSKTCQLEEITSSKNTSAKNLFNAFCENGTSPQENEAVLQHQKTSKSPTKTRHLEQITSSKNTSAKNLFNASCENGTSPQDNEAGLQHQKTSKSPTKSRQLEQITSSKNTSAKNLFSASCENGTSPQDNEAGLQHQTTSKSPTKTRQLEQITSPKNTSAKNLFNASCENGTSPQDNEAGLQHQKTSKSLTKTRQLEQITSSKNTSAKNLFNASCENGTSPQDNEAVLQHQKTSKSSTKTPQLDRSVTKRNVLPKKVNCPCECGTNLKNNKEVSQDQKTSKRPQLERNTSLSGNTSAKKIDNLLLDNNICPQENAGNFEISKNSLKTPEQKRNLSPRNPSAKTIDNTLIIQENGNNADEKKSPKTLIPESNVSPGSSSVNKIQNISMSYEEETMCLQDTESDASPESPELETDLSFLKVISSVLQTDLKDTKISKTPPQILMTEKSISPQNSSRKKISNRVEENGPKDEIQIEKDERSEIQQRNSPKCKSNSIEIITQKTEPINEQIVCEHCERLDDQNKSKPFLILPGQTTILKYFKPLKTTNMVDTAKGEGENTPSPKKKVVTNKEFVVAKSLRGNIRPSLFMDNVNAHPRSPEFVPENTPDKDEIPKKETFAKNNFCDFSRHHCSASTKRKRQASPCARRRPWGPKNLKTDVKIKSRRKVQNVPSPVTTPSGKKQSNKRLRSPAAQSSEQQIRSCYVKLVKLSEETLSSFNVDSCNGFSGFGDNDIKNAVDKKSKFKKFLKLLENGVKKSASDTSEADTWLGWDDTIPGRSIVVNGFLIDKYSK